MSAVIRIFGLLVVYFSLWIVAGIVFGLIVHSLLFGIGVFLIIGIICWALCAWGAEKFTLDVYGAELLDTHRDPRLYELTKELSRRAGIDAPILYRLPLQTPNACAVARTHGEGAIAVSSGLMQGLERAEIRAVVAMMIARVTDGDAKVWSLAATLAGWPLYFVRLGYHHDLANSPKEINPSTEISIPKKALLAIMLPFCALFLRVAFNAKSVHRADATALQLTGDRDSLESAMKKLEMSVPQNWWDCSGYNFATALLFASPPLPSHTLLTDHPPFWLRALLAFPYYSPSLEERREMLRDVRFTAVNAIDDDFTKLDEVERFISELTNE